MRRRAFLTSGAATMLPAPAFAQGTRPGTLRMIPQVNLTVLDPILSTAGSTLNHGYAVFDTLYGTDANFVPRPQMADGHSVSDDRLTWLIRLRDGLRFHDGEPVRARDCAASLARWSRRDTFGQTLGAAVEAFEAADDRTVRIRLKRPFPQLLVALGYVGPIPAFIMPERLARTDPFTAVPDIVGSGPYRFLPGDYVSNSRVAYARFDGYVPRQEAPSLSAGGKVAHFDRVEWHVIPDSSTASAALQSGSVDWWEYVDSDLAPVLARRRDIRLQPYDPLGFISYLRFNALHPPFDNPRLRRIVLEAVNQADYMTVISGGDSQFWRPCYSMFPMGLPQVRDTVGAPIMGAPKDFDRLKRRVEEAGYRGERVVVMNPSDFPLLSPNGPITAEVLRRLGFNVDLQTMDWGTVLQRRGSREPLDRGGWSIFHTLWKSRSMANPALNSMIRGQGRTGFFGWYESPAIEQLTQDWLQAADEPAQQALVDRIQAIAFEDAPSVPLGIFMPKTAYRSDISGIVPGPSAFPWSVRRG